MSNTWFDRRVTKARTPILIRLLTAIPVIIVLLFFPRSAQSEIPQQERAALIALFNNLGGTDWIKKTGWLGSPGTECSWYGVTCDTVQTSVTGIDLPAMDCLETFHPKSAI